MLSEKKNTHPAVGAAERAEAGTNFADQIPSNYITCGCSFKSFSGVNL